MKLGRALTAIKGGEIRLQMQMLALYAINGSARLLDQTTIREEEE